MLFFILPLTNLLLGKTFNVKFHKNCENKIFIITILILQIFLLHLLTVLQLNFKKTWEMLLKGKPTKALPVPLASIERKPSLKLLGVTFQSDPRNYRGTQRQFSENICSEDD